MVCLPPEDSFFLSWDGSTVSAIYFLWELGKVSVSERWEFGLDVTIICRAEDAIFYLFNKDSMGSSHILGDFWMTKLE